jgi:hypothetical protein
MNEARIKLAKAMGWTVAPITLEDCGGPFLVCHGAFSEDNDDWHSFNPFTDANDCEALIRWLNEQGWIVNVDWSSEHSVKIWRFRNPDTKEFTWQGNNWKQGVCELALKVLPIQTTS